jgi:L-alanine-DL-glutamate epimerase-like enolase superfamily enzyme
MAKSKKIQLKKVKSTKHTYPYRMPMKFGGRTVESVEVESVQVTVESADGQHTAIGHGSMTLGVSWAWPSQKMSPVQTHRVLRGLVDKLNRSVVTQSELGHPIEIGMKIIEHANELAKELETAMKLVEPIPELAVMLACAALDAAVHDAFGRLNGCSSYETLSSEWLDDDLSKWLGPDFVGKYLDDYILPKPKNTLALYHLVGALDPLTTGEITQRVHDDLPETLEEWLQTEGLTHLKVKLDGADIDWDVGRVIEIDRIASRVIDEREFSFSLDFNERCPSEDYVLEFLERVDRLSGNILPRVQYIEQPIDRDLKSRKDITMHRVSRLKPIVIDESLVDIDTIRFAKQQGYSGVALKTCKTHTKSLLMAAAAAEYKMFICVQDLTCVGSSFLQSAAFAAHLPGVDAVEGNGRQYCPDANWEWEATYRPLFRIRSGVLPTELLSSDGLGCDIPPKRPKKKPPVQPPEPAPRRVARKDGSNTKSIKKTVKTAVRKPAPKAAPKVPVKPSLSAADAVEITKAKAKRAEAKQAAADRKAAASDDVTAAKKKSSKTVKPASKTATAKAPAEKKSAKKKTPTTSSKAPPKKSAPANSAKKLASKTSTSKRKVAKKK